MKISRRQLRQLIIEQLEESSVFDRLGGFIKSQHDLSVPDNITDLPENNKENIKLIKIFFNDSTQGFELAQSLGSNLTGIFRSIRDDVKQIVNHRLSDKEERRRAHAREKDPEILYVNSRNRAIMKARYMVKLVDSSDLVNELEDWELQMRRAFPHWGPDAALEDYRLWSEDWIGDLQT